MCLCVGLSCCVGSDKPLVLPDQAVFPFEVITFVECGDADPDPNSCRLGQRSSGFDPITLIHEGSSYVIVARTTYEPFYSKFVDGGTYRLYPVGNDLYIVQTSNDDKSSSVAYGLVQINWKDRYIRELDLTKLTESGRSGLRECGRDDDPFAFLRGGKKLFCLDNLKTLADLAVKFDSKEKVADTYVILATLPTLAPLQDALKAAQRGNYPTALSTLRPLSARGDADAQATLGLMYYSGKGVPQENAAALKWFRLAAEQGNAKAQINLAVMYEKGQGIPVDAVEASRLYALAAAQGDAQAKSNLEAMRSRGAPLPRLESPDAAYEKYVYQANQSISASDWTSVIANMNKAIQLKPSDAAIYDLRAQAYKTMGKLPDALKDYVAAMHLTPETDSNYDSAQREVVELQARISGTETALADAVWADCKDVMNPVHSIRACWRAFSGSYFLPDVTLHACAKVEDPDLSIDNCTFLLSAR
jgi:TPR repeat protein